MKKESIIVKSTSAVAVTKNKASILPLNMPLQTYQCFFNEPPPHHLGIGFVYLYPENINTKDGMRLFVGFDIATIVLEELLEYEEFRSEFLPDGVDRVSVTACFAETPEGYWEEFFDYPMQLLVDGAVIQIVFYDADKTSGDLFMVDMGMAMAFIDSWAVENGTYDPSFHSSKYIDSEAAESYKQNVSDLYTSGIGKWSDSLVELRNNLMVFIRAKLESAPMVKLMREFAESGHKFYWEIL